MKEQVQKIKEFIWQKYVDYAHPSSELNEEEALAVLDQHFAAVNAEDDPETYYLGILLFELAFNHPDRQNLFLARAKINFEEYRTRTGETDWDVIEDRLEEVDDTLSGLGPDERAQLFASVESSAPAPGGGEAPRTTTIAGPDGMVLVSAGAFLSGRSNEEKEVEAFYIDVYPVTNEEYRKFVDARGYRPPKFWSEKRLMDPAAPVVGVSWYDADKYAAWAGKRLPTREQWEKAARGLEGRIYPWGNEIDAGKANFGHVDGDDLVCPVTKFEENRSVFGACDMAGNVWEWTRDWDEIEIDMKVICGGSWADPAGFLRCNRHLYANPKDKYDNIGFRCVKDV